MIGILNKEARDGTNPEAAADLSQLQRWRDELDVQIELEQINRGTYRRRPRPSLQS